MNWFQEKVAQWCIECFGEAKAHDVLERQWRFIEESLELVQALGMTADDCHKLVEYVFGRPKGEPNQELGGVMVTLAALATPADLIMEEAGWTEFKRINRPEIIEKIRAKQAAKDKAGLYTHDPLPGQPS